MSNQAEARQVLNMYHLGVHTLQRLDGLLQNVYGKRYALEDVQLLRERFKHTHSRDTMTELVRWMSKLSVQLERPQTPEEAVDMIHMTAVTELYVNMLRDVLRTDFGVALPKKPVSVNSN